MGNMGFLAGTTVKSIYKTFKRCCFGGLYTLSPSFSNFTMYVVNLSVCSNFIYAKSMYVIDILH